MKETKVSKEFEWLGEYYRVSKYHGSEVMEIEVMVPNGFWGKSNMIYQRIYMGHEQPIEAALNFFKENSAPKNQDS